MHLLVDCSAQFICEFGDVLAVGFLSKLAGDLAPRAGRLRVRLC
jgi:hypothetical protein